ncbi:MAG: hypothetical protein V1685_06565 [Parcubacteria group bacterium]
MKRITYKKGEYSQFKLNGQRLFLETLPSVVRIKKMFTGFIPTKTLWSYSFPFYIRTVGKAWPAAEEILDMVLQELSNSDDFKLTKTLNPILDEYVRINQKKADDFAFNQLGSVAFKARK